MVTKIKTIEHPAPVTGPIHCACLIHGVTYDWTYVDKLYNMLNRHISVGIKLHVYTEKERPVPDHMIKHELEDWGISGPRCGWWYKLQLFNSNYHAGPMMYFDLDTVIVDNIDWIWNLPLRYFWALQDFKYLWRPSFQGLNSSVMWWDTRMFHHIWKNFQPKHLSAIMKEHAGDQDYLSKEIDEKFLRFLNTERVKSWRWQCLDGGFNFKQKIYLSPKTGTNIPSQTSVLIFHGRPKPAQLDDPIIKQHWV